ncbi:MAG: galactose oxidase-like domain-containing protein [Methylocella sp.]
MRRIDSLLGATFPGWVAPRGCTKITLCILVVIAGAAINTDVFSQSPRLDIFRLEKDKKAPVDYGFGPGAGIGPARPNLVLGQTPGIPKSMRVAPKAALGTVPIGGGAGGFFGPSFPWPIIPIHMALLPSGSVLNYGTDQTGAQGAELLYDVWDPTLGNGSNAHTILPNGTLTDIFCGAASLIGEGPFVPTSLTSNMLITGGDSTVTGVRNFSNNKVNVFNPGNNTLTASGTMNFPRWYHSITSLRNGDKLLLGGTLSPGMAAMTPEFYHPASGIWTTLPGISISDATFPSWYYPRGFLAPDGGVTLLQHNGRIFKITTTGAGTIQDTGSLTAPGAVSYPSVMFAPFKVLTVRANHRAQVVDISVSPPVVKDVANLSYDRIWGNATLLPDGEILVTGGSAVDNELTNVAYQAEIFNPVFGSWTLGASAAIPRLYHSGALLLPDGSVLTGGGGAPGPVNELNAEIYYPAYLYLKDGSGNPAPRPTIVAAPSRLTLGQSFLMTVGSTDQIGFVDLVRVGSNTHSFNPEQRLIPVAFTQSGTTVKGSVDPAPEKIPPFNTNGVPAVAKIASVPQSVP